MKCHKCAVVSVCGNAKRILMEKGIDLDSGARYCPLATLIKNVFAGVLKQVEEAKKAEGSKRSSKPSEKKS